MTLWKVTELNGDCVVFVDKMINYQRIWLKFLQLVENLLIYISYKICKLSLMSINLLLLIFAR